MQEIEMSKKRQINDFDVQNVGKCPEIVHKM